jgi:hypothetical protein
MWIQKAGESCWYNDDCGEADSPACHIYTLGPYKLDNLAVTVVGPVRKVLTATLMLTNVITTLVWKTNIAPLHIPAKMTLLVCDQEEQKCKSPSDVCIGSMKTIMETVNGW